MDLVGVQVNTEWEQKDLTFDRVRALLAANPPAPGSLVALPEMFSTGFSMNVETIAEGEDRPAERFLSELAHRYQSAFLGGVVTKSPDGRGRNEAVLARPNGAPPIRYQKIHPFSYGGETTFYEPGREVVRFDWGGFSVAPFVCYDLRFPEIFRKAVGQGAQVFVVIANWPQAREQHWLALLKARAIENQAYVIGVNRCGSDPNVTYSGRSQIIDPRGDVLQDAGEGEGIIRQTLNLELLVEYRKTFPALLDMRP